MIRKVLLGLLVILLIMLVWQRELLSYGWMQARGQLRVITESKDINEFLEDPTFPDSLKQKLQLINEIKEFSINELGIDDHGSYQTMYDEGGKVTLYNLTACYPYELKARTWSFPILGQFPYKGFFDLEKARQERDKLKAEGFDTRIRAVGGWSTLGWFEDPILSNMLNRSEGELAELIIHELTHGTLYIKDSADYNENLATFIGEQGAIQFLKFKYGESSEVLQTYLEDESDRKKYIDHFIRGSLVLDSIYRRMEGRQSDEEKSKLKQEYLANIVSSLDTVDFFNASGYGGRFQNSLPNNAYFMSFLRYHSRQTDFSEDFEQNFGGNVRTYLTYLKQKYPSL